jgi:hypothetical protein
MIEHVYRRSASARGVDAVIVATDDERIAAAVRAFGGVVVMTRPVHRTGTDRIAEVAANLCCEIVLNVQGDEPLIEPAIIEAVIAPLAADPMLDMATVCVPISDKSDYGNPDVVKVVKDRSGRALYFSRAPIPHFRVGPPERRLQTHRHLRLSPHVPVEVRHAAGDPARARRIARTTPRVGEWLSHSHRRNQTRLYRRRHARGSGARTPPVAGGHRADMRWHDTTTLR